MERKEEQFRREKDNLERMLATVQFKEAEDDKLKIAEEQQK